MKKYLAIILALVLMLTLFVGCGAKSAPSGESEKTTAAPKTDEQAIKDDLKKEFNMDNYEEFVAAGLKADEEFVQIAQEAGLDIDEYIANNDTSKLTESEAQKLVCDIMMDILKSEDLPLTSEDFDIDYIKEDGAWKMAETEEVEKAMVAAQGLDAAA